MSRDHALRARREVDALESERDTSPAVPSGALSFEGEGAVEAAVDMMAAMAMMGDGDFLVAGFIEGLLTGARNEASGAEAQVELDEAQEWFAMQVDMARDNSLYEATLRDTVDSHLYLEQLADAVTNAQQSVSDRHAVEQDALDERHRVKREEFAGAEALMCSDPMNAPEQNGQWERIGRFQNNQCEQLAAQQTLERNTVVVQQAAVAALQEQSRREWDGLLQRAKDGEFDQGRTLFEQCRTLATQVQEQTDSLKMQFQEQARTLREQRDLMGAQMEREQASLQQAVYQPASSDARIPTLDDGPKGQKLIHDSREHTVRVSVKDEEKIKSYEDLINFHLPESVQKQLENRARLQRMEDGAGPISLDYYSVKITQLPKEDGRTLTPEEFLSRARRNFGDFVNGDAASFRAYDLREAAKWQSDSPLGSVMHFDMLVDTNFDMSSSIVVDRNLNLRIDFNVHFDMLPMLSENFRGLKNMDDGSVVMSRSEPDSWIFSTISTLDDLGHPVSGNRQFGLVAEADGSYTFYTRGADRPTGWIDEKLQDLIFEGADKLWRSVMDKMTDYVNKHEGVATIGNAWSERLDWDTVQKQRRRGTQ